MRNIYTFKNLGLSLIPVLFLLTMGTISGCRHLDPAGVYQGDQVMYNAELITPTAYDLLHTFVSWEQQNRALITKWPEITRYADFVRLHRKEWFATANRLHDAYKIDPSQVNRDALAAALAVLQSALIEANGYMLRGATQFNPK